MRDDRSIDAFVHLLQAMHTSGKNAIATPEGWTPICGVMVLQPKTAKALAHHAGEGHQTGDRYCSTQSL